MRRYWVSPEARTDEQLCLEGEEFHHIIDVCRHEVGQSFEALFGDGTAHLVKIIKVEKKRAYCEILEKRVLPEIKKPYLKLCLSVPRFPVFEAVVEKAVELGVSEIIPFFSDHSFVKTQDAISDSRFERWNKIVKSATQQSGRGELMQISQPVSLDNLVKRFNQIPDAAGLFCYEGQGVLDMKNWKESQKSMPQEIWAFIGSEGGFSPREVEKFQAVKLQAVTLGQQVLRVETACVAILGVLKYQWDLLK